MIPHRFAPLFAALLLVASGHAGKIDGYDSKAIETALKGKKIVVQVGCPEEPRLNDDIAKTFASHFPGIPEDDSAFRARVTQAFYDGLSRKAGSRIEFDSGACRSGAKSKTVTDLDGHAAMIDGSRISGSKAYLALGMLLYEPPSYWEQELARKSSPLMNAMTGAKSSAIGARMSFGIYDTQERLLVYHATGKAAANDDYLVIQDVSAKHWTMAAALLGEKIGEKIAKLPGK